MTVPVLELRPPELPTSKARLLLWRTWLGYAVSYLFIAIVWTNYIILCVMQRKRPIGRCGSISHIFLPYPCFRSPPLGWP
jgi:uncharacterized membrane protein